jgi:DhnA family fructose-bisphosphate aldolase class Ia
MNRGGLKSAVFEMDDRFTAYDIPSIVAAGIDFAKLLVRINLADPASVATIEKTARAIDDAAAAGIPIMLEPFMSEWHNGTITNDLSTDAVVKSVAITSGLGNSSAYSWLKLPVVPDMARVMEATTMPTLLLGGDPSTSPDETYASWGNALALPGVRGLVVGRTLLYPPDGDVASAVDTASALVHS